MHQDGELQREQDNLYELAGFESAEPVKPRQVKPANFVGVSDS